MQLNGQSDLNFLWDKHQSSVANAENLISLHRILYEFENKTIKPSYWKENNFGGKILGVGYRFSKTILLDYQIDFLVHLLQHELFGHGYRYREFEYEDNSFNLNLAPPYGTGGGFARRGTPDYNRQLGQHEEIAIRSGGMEAAAVLARSLRRKWLIRGEINYRESLLYLSTFHDYSVYIIGTKLFDAGEEPRNDVNNYLRAANASYGFTREENYQLSLKELAINSSINLVNTFQLFALYTYLKVYVYDGEESFTYPTIGLGKTEWVPAVRFGLTPFGSEFIIENHLKSEKAIWEFDVRIGDNKLDNFWGGGVSYFKEISDKLLVSTNADFWHQPAMELGGETTFKTNRGIGGRLIGEINLHFNDSFPVGIYGQAGYKSTGFIEGERLDRGLIIRIGASFRNTSGSGKL